MARHFTLLVAEEIEMSRLERVISLMAGDVHEI